MKNKRIVFFHPVLYIIILVMISPIYSILNESTKGAVDVTTRIDDYIPFIKEFVIPYILWYPFLYGALIYYCFVDRKKYYVALSSIIFGKLFCFIIYYFWQSTVPRPEVVGTDIFSQLVLLVYNSDQPVNCLPSIHVLTTFVIMLVVLQRKGQNKWEYTIGTVMGTLIILSTLFMKQHAILDVFTGMFVAGAFYIALQFAFAKVKVYQPKPYKVREVEKTRNF